MMSARMRRSVPSRSAATSTSIRLLARVDVREERLAAAGDELHRPAEGHREGACGHVVLVDVDLDPEAPAHVGRDHAHAMLGQRRAARATHRLHHVRDLGRHPSASARACGLEVRHEPARLHRHAGVPAAGERPALDARRAGEGARHVAARDTRVSKITLSPSSGWISGASGAIAASGDEHRGQGRVLDAITSATASSASARAPPRRPRRPARPRNARGRSRAAVIAPALHPRVVPQHAAIGLAEPAASAPGEDGGDAGTLRGRPRARRRVRPRARAGSARRRRGPCEAARGRRRSGRGPVSMRGSSRRLSGEPT